jgi:hypothetical protein
MTTEKAPALPSSFQELEALMKREFSEPDRMTSYSQQRLQPTVLPPPPGEEVRQTDVTEPPSSPASAADDIIPDLSEQLETGRKRNLILLASIVVLLGGGAIGGLMMMLTPRAPMNPPEIAAPVGSAKAPALPAPQQTEAAAAPVTVPAVQVQPTEVARGIPQATVSSPAVQSAAQPSAEVSMGVVSDELVAPQTDGLTPARRVQTIRIVVENDREVTPRR